MKNTKTSLKLTSQPFFSIVVPTYNRADLIAATLQSLLHQTYRNYEIIVVDDGSTDNTEEVIRAHFRADQISYFKKANAERAAARNYGARMAKGDFVNFFDSDDLALPNHLEEAAKLVVSKGDPEWFHLAYAWANAEGKVYQEVNTFTGHTLNAQMHKGNRLSCNGVFIRKDIILNNPFNEDRILSASEDYELWLRLTAQYPLYYSNTISSLIINHDERSIHTMNGYKLKGRLEAFIQYVEANSQLKEYFKETRFNRIRVEGYSYMAVYLAMVPKFKGQAFSYLVKSVGYDPTFLLSKRFYATLKNLLIKWQTS